ncbi:MAG: pilus assembly protein PilM [Firmicutes bacterium]|nr:pilus assembly protein PilM [Bacillota bacterium]
MSQTPIFALDIGTHKIAGLLMRKSNDGYQIEHGVMLEQLPQAMRDGQIHNIASVAKVIRQVKSQLEKASGMTLSEAAVAAAGRSLETRTSEARRVLHPAEPLTEDAVKALELQAVANAMRDLTKPMAKNALESYLCVGCSVVRSYLDGEPIGSLIGHRGTEAKVEVIATFLPRVVIDSLAAALEMAGLEMASITLEPIAAMHIAIPATMRMLNIALVDVGAGTSDIAVAADGTIIGYGMVAAGGDRITERIAQTFLLDFLTAELAKRMITPGSAVTCQDVFGNTIQLVYEEVINVILPEVQQLAKDIAAQIISLNGSSPKGVLLVGGGSQTPEVCALIQEQLQLPGNLVRIRDRSSLTTVKGQLERSGPDVITPIGIGCAHLDGIAMQLVKASVNGHAVQFLKLPSSTVSDALLYAGYTQEDLMGAGGDFITVTIGGKPVELPPTSGASAEILLDGKRVDLSTLVHDGAVIEVRPPDHGRSTPTSLADLVDSEAACFTVCVNGEEVRVEPRVIVNGAVRNLDYQIADGDTIEISPVKTVGQLLELLGVQQYHSMSFTVNGSDRTISRPVQLSVNGEVEPWHRALTPGMRIAYRQPEVTLAEVLPEEASAPISVTVNGKVLKLTPTVTDVLVNGEPRPGDYLVRPGDVIQFDARTFGFIVTDVFRVYQPDPEFMKRGGKITVNGITCGFTSPLRDGDVVEFQTAAEFIE